MRYSQVCLQMNGKHRISILVSTNSYAYRLSYRYVWDILGHFTPQNQESRIKNQESRIKNQVPSTATSQSHYSNRSQIPLAALFVAHIYHYLLLVSSWCIICIQSSVPVVMIITLIDWFAIRIVSSFTLHTGMGGMKIIFIFIVKVNLHELPLE